MSVSISFFLFLYFSLSHSRTASYTETEPLLLWWCVCMCVFLKVYMKRNLISFPFPVSVSVCVFGLVANPLCLPPRNGGHEMERNCPVCLGFLPLARRGRPQTNPPTTSLPADHLAPPPPYNPRPPWLNTALLHTSQGHPRRPAEHRHRLHKAFPCSSLAEAVARCHQAGELRPRPT